MSLKAQADVISAVIIIILAIGLASSAYLWGLPLIQKRQEVTIAERARSYFSRETPNSLVKKIESVAKNGGEDSFTSEISGIWTLFPHDYPGPENNSIHFTFRSKVSNLAPDAGWIPLESASVKPTGTIGIDDSSVIFGKSESSGGAFMITYKIWFRQLNSSYEEKYYKTLLLPRNPSNPNTSTANTIKISRLEEPKEVGNNIITEIKILLG